MKKQSEKDTLPRENRVRYISKTFVYTRRAVYWILILVGLVIVTRAAGIYLIENILVRVGEETTGTIEESLGSKGWSAPAEGLTGRRTIHSSPSIWKWSINFRDKKGYYYSVDGHSQKPANNENTVLYLESYPHLACIKSICAKADVLYNCAWGLPLIALGMVMRRKTRKIVAKNSDRLE